MESTEVAAAIAEVIPPRQKPSAVGHANAEELGAILDIATEGRHDVRRGLATSIVQTAAWEALFGYDGRRALHRNLHRTVRAGKSARSSRNIWRVSKAPGSKACSITAARLWAVVREAG